MFTACVLGLLSSPRFVGCGAQFRFGSLLISNLLAEFPCFGTVDCCYHSLYVCGCWSTLVLGLQPSCFGHGRAKNNSVLPYGLELCSSFVWDYPWSSLLLHRAMKGWFCCM